MCDVAQDGERQSDAIGLLTAVCAKLRLPPPPPQQQGALLELPTNSLSARCVWAVHVHKPRRMSAQPFASPITTPRHEGHLRRERERLSGTLAAGKPLRWCHLLAGRANTARGGEIGWDEGGLIREGEGQGQATLSLGVGGILRKQTATQGAVSKSDTGATFAHQARGAINHRWIAALHHGAAAENWARCESVRCRAIVAMVQKLLATAAEHLHEWLHSFGARRVRIQIEGHLIASSARLFH
ncbi:hypothetical protein AAFF_G00049320 [Aldrovandia affinis]|uniref:Uncharacterized protein n=1 Tax=Aldrovandia affinis TaxID=143900 RepID=A0AAD7S1A1_9TELE|nr:hypothetical protein AAFF_G00049320 [Aldrovandia affinis]